MKKKIFIMAILMLIGTAAYAESSTDIIIGRSIPVEKVGTATWSGYHSFSANGCEGATVYVCLDNNFNYCYYMEPDNKPDGKVYLVLDDYHKEAGVFDQWLAMLLIAQQTKRKIDFDGKDLGVNSKGFRVIRPYKIELKQE